jgi:predicted acetyltransferase
MTVIVTKASHSQDPIIQNLAQLYTHDFSEFRTDTAKGDLLLDGRFEAYPLEGYWTRPGWWASMIWCDEALAGFALINDHAHSGKPVDHSVSEFFVLRKYRGRGVGRLAAETRSLSLARTFPPAPSGQDHHWCAQGEGGLRDRRE